MTIYFKINPETNYGFTQSQTNICIAVDLRNQTNITMHWSKNKMGWCEWLHRFVKRNNLFLRILWRNGITRIAEFNQSIVEEFYNLLREVLNHPTLGLNIFNSDESRYKTVHQRIWKISEKRQKQKCNFKRIYPFNSYCFFL